MKLSPLFGGVSLYMFITKKNIMKNSTENWEKHLQPIIDEFNEESNEPLDGDQVDQLTKIIKLKINFMQGNLTPSEFKKKLNCLK